MCSVRKKLNTMIPLMEKILPITKKSLCLVNIQFSLLVSIPILPGPTYPAQTKPKPVSIVPPIGSSVGYCPCR